MCVSKFNSGRSCWTFNEMLSKFSGETKILKCKLFKISVNVKANFTYWPYK